MTSKFELDQKVEFDDGPEGKRLGVITGISVTTKSLMPTYTVKWIDGKYKSGEEYIVGERYLTLAPAIPKFKVGQTVRYTPPRFTRRGKVLSWHSKDGDVVVYEVEWEAEVVPGYVNTICEDQLDP